MNALHRFMGASQELASFPIVACADVVRARQTGSTLASSLGFGVVDQTRIATAVSEITRNVLQHSGTVGTIKFWRTAETRFGLLIEVDDRGCGIADVVRAMQDGYSTAVASLGAGLPGARRLMDEFEIESTVGKGTTVRMLKCLPRRR